MSSVRLNYTAFTSASMALKITAAMSHCLSTGEVVRVANRRGKEFLLVAIVKDRLGYTFSFRSMYDDAEVGGLILKGHHIWPDEYAQAFWSLTSASYDLTEHPFVTVSKRDIGIHLENGASVLVKDNEVTYTIPAGLAVNMVHHIDHKMLIEQQRVKDALHKMTGATHKATDGLGRVVYLSYKKSWFGLGKTKTLKHVLEENSEGLWDEYKMKVNGEAFTIQGVL